MTNEHNTSQQIQGSEQSDVKAAAKRILHILGLHDKFLTAAIAAVEVELKRWSNLSLDGAVERIATAASLTRDISKEEFLNDFLVQSSAKRILEVLNLPITNSSVRRLTAVVKAEAKDTGFSTEETAIRITRAATEDRSRGIAINMFYFEDVKWRSNVTATRAEKRKLENLAANARARDLLRQQRH